MEKTDAFSLFFSVFLTLAFVLLLAWFFLHWMGRSSPLMVNSKHIKILDRVVIDREKYLLLVSVGDKTMLIAMSSGAVQTICEFDLAEKDIYFKDIENSQSFSSVFKQMMPNKKEGDGN